MLISQKTCEKLFTLKTTPAKCTKLESENLDFFESEFAVLTNLLDFLGASFQQKLSYALIVAMDVLT